METFYQGAIAFDNSPPTMVDRVVIPRHPIATIEVENDFTIPLKAFVTCRPWMAFGFSYLAGANFS
jgi:hypothetical protein